MFFECRIFILYFFFFKQKTAYEIKECDWSSDVCSSDLRHVDFIEPEETGSMGEVEASKYMFRKGLEFIRHNPVTFLKMSVKKVGRLWRVFPYWTSGFTNIKYKLISIFSYGLILPFFLIGVFLSIRNWKLVLPLYCLIVYTSIFCMVFYGTMRFRLPLMPAVIVLGSVGIDRLLWKK